MKNLIILTALVFIFGFIESENTVFKSADGKTKITARADWLAAGNMKGVEIYISHENKKTNFISTIVVSKDEGLIEGTNLNSYSASKLFIQTAVLSSTPSFSGIKNVNGKLFKYYEYEYNNKDLIKMKTLVYHALQGLTGYQMVITAHLNGFDQYKPMFNKIANSLIIQP